MGLCKSQQTCETQEKSRLRPRFIEVIDMKKFKLLMTGDIQEISDFVFENRTKFSKFKPKKFRGKIALFGRK